MRYAATVRFVDKKNEKCTVKYKTTRGKKGKKKDAITETTVPMSQVKPIECIEELDISSLAAFLRAVGLSEHLVELSEVITVQSRNCF